MSNQPDQIGAVNYFADLDGSPEIPVLLQNHGIGRINFDADIGGQRHERAVRVIRDRVDDRVPGLFVH